MGLNRIEAAHTHKQYTDRQRSELEQLTHYSVSSCQFSHYLLFAVFYPRRSSCPSSVCLSLCPRVVSLYLAVVQVDLALESGEYFLSAEQKKEKELEDRRVKNKENKLQRAQKRAAEFVPPKVCASGDRFMYGIHCSLLISLDDFHSSEFLCFHFGSSQQRSVFMTGVVVAPLSWFACCCSCLCFTYSFMHLTRIFLTLSLISSCRSPPERNPRKLLQSQQTIKPCYYLCHVRNATATCVPESLRLTRCCSWPPYLSPSSSSLPSNTHFFCALSLRFPLIPVCPTQERLWLNALLFANNWLLNN